MLLAASNMQGSILCEQHNEILKLFCEDDHVAICLVCRESRDHKGHNVLPIQEAALEYKVKCQSWLDSLKMEKEASVKKKSNEMNTYNNLRSDVEAERSSALATIEVLHQSLNQAELSLFQQTKDMIKNISKVENANITKLSDEISDLGKLIAEIERKCSQPAEDFLRDVKSMLRRCNEVKFQDPEAMMQIPKEMPQSLDKTTPKRLLDQATSALPDNSPQGNYSMFGGALTSPASSGYMSEDRRSSFGIQTNTTAVNRACAEWLLPGIDGLQQDKRSLLDDYETQAKQARIAVTDVDTGNRNVMFMRQYKVVVTMDPETAHPCLNLCRDGRRLSNTGFQKSLPVNSKRFITRHCVLGSEGFTSGKHYWEVEVLKVGDGWSVGIAGESVNRNGRITQSPFEGIWAVGRRKGKFVAFSVPYTPLFLNDKLRKLGVYLDFEAGHLSVCNAETMEHLYMFNNTFLHKLFPYFHVDNRAELILI